MKQNLRRILLCAALTGLPFVRIKALDWVPVGTNVGNNGQAMNGDYYNGSDVIGDGVENEYSDNMSFSATADDNTLNVYGTLYDNFPAAGGTEVIATPKSTETSGEPYPCSLKINGNVIIEAVEADAIVNFNQSTTGATDSIVFEPYFNVSAASNKGPGGPAESGVSQIQFYAAVGKTITVNVNTSVKFASKTVLPGQAGGYQDMVVSFSGPGKIVFNQVGGTTIVFEGQEDTTTPFVLNPETGFFEMPDNPSLHAGACKAFVWMDQVADDVAAGKDKLVFQRHPNDPYPDSDILVGVGKHAVFTYLSTNYTGLSSPEYSVDGDCASVAFDVSNPNGVGRSVLFIQGAKKIDNNPYDSSSELAENPNYKKIVEKYPFMDGCVSVCGSYITDFSAESASSPANYESESIFGYDFTTPAGIKAVMRVIDNQEYNAATKPYAPAATKRYGLLIVNDAQTHGSLIADPYWSLYTDPNGGYISSDYAQSNGANVAHNLRTGFVLGVNGAMDVYHNTFVDFAAGSTNQDDPIVNYDFVNQTLFKRKNPSALKIDGIPTSLFMMGNPTFSSGTDINPASDFEAANPYTQANPVKAQITLRGDAALYLKSVASTDYGYATTLFDPETGFDPFVDPTLDWTAVFDLGGSFYDGYQLSAVETDVDGNPLQVNGGHHVLDVEGDFVVAGKDNTTCLDENGQARSYASTASHKAVITMASLLLNNNGREIMANEDLLQRPLLNDGSEYHRYNTPGMFLNRTMELYDVVLDHSDATKYVDGLPHTSDPAYTGGELKWFMEQFWGKSNDNVISDPNRFRLPEIQLYNSLFNLQESAALSGLRVVVKDIAGLSDRSGDNISAFQFCDHGTPLDTVLTGYGRVLLFGSQLNQMSDPSNSTNAATQSAYLNIFKQNAGEVATGSSEVSANFELENSARVVLSLQNGDQFTQEVQDIINTTPSYREKLRAHHLIMFAQPETASENPSAAGAGANLTVGWGGTVSQDDSVAGIAAPYGDAAAFPGSYPYQGEPLVTDEQLFATAPFSLDALKVPPATLSIDGSVICFGSYDKKGRSIKTPVTSDDDSGAIYVKHGGKITMSDSARANFATMLAQRVWNDYDYDGTKRVIQLSGDIDLPHDQVTFNTNYAVQPYNLTDQMFAARRKAAADGGTEGYVRLSFRNEDRARAADASGASNVLVGWFNREAADLAAPTFNSAPTLPVKSKHMKSYSPTGLWHSRAVASVDGPIERPTDLLYVGPGDDIQQMRVAGATMSDPFILDVSGDGVYPNTARVREFTSHKTTRDEVTDTFISEGAHGALLLQYGGRIGLGSRAANQHSVDAWNMLGKNYVSIVPMGDGTVDLNSNLVVADRLAFIPGKEFSQDRVNRVTLTSVLPYEIRVPAGQELDFSGFGQGNFRQEIAFGGNVRLVLEPGATIRLPNNPSGGFVLYFNDNAQLVFESQGGGSAYLPFNDLRAPIKNARCRILGKGQIWLNKNSQMRVDNAVNVAVQTDDVSPSTDLTISIQRQAGMFLGDASVAGGSFEVGNPTDQAGSNINFSLLVNGVAATLHLDREAFLGLGAGIVNKNGAPNGDASEVNNPARNADGTLQTDQLSGSSVPVFNPATSASSGVWNVTPLFNVNTVTLQLTNGFVDHRNTVAGNASTASLLAVGPAAAYNVALASKANCVVRGGGNLMLVPSDTSIPYAVTAWDYAGQVASGESYSIMASGDMIIDRAIGDNSIASNLFGGNNTGRAYSFAGDTADASAAACFDLLSARPFQDQGGNKRVSLAQGQLSNVIAYVDTTDANKYAGTAGGEIVRSNNFNIVGGGDIADALRVGHLDATAGNDNRPSGYSISK